MFSNHQQSDFTLPVFVAQLFDNSISKDEPLLSMTVSSATAQTAHEAVTTLLRLNDPATEGRFSVKIVDRDPVALVNTLLQSLDGYLSKAA